MSTLKILVRVSSDYTAEIRALSCLKERSVWERRLIERFHMTSHKLNLCSKTIKWWPFWCSKQNKPVGVELSYVNPSFDAMNLQSYNRFRSHSENALFTIFT